jgi:hypothetical protein
LVVVLVQLLDCKYGKNKELRVIVLLDSSSNDFGIEEWKLAREVFEKFDDRQHDLRKYGFTFLTALIAADSLTKLVKDADDRIRLTVVGVTLLLTVALKLLDKNYELFMSATAMRAKILEVRLNLELTETISFRHEWDRFDRYVLGVYVLFAAVTGAVGTALLYPGVLFSALVLTFTGIAVIALVAIHLLKPNLERTVDWSFDRIMFTQGEKARIILTNLGNKPVSFDEEQVVWEVRKEGETGLAYSEKAPSEGIIVAAGGNYIWEFPKEKLDLESGIYRVFPGNVRQSKEKGTVWSRPMKRAIIISKPKPPEKPTQKDK